MPLFFLTSRLDDLNLITIAIVIVLLVSVCDVKGGYMIPLHG